MFRRSAKLLIACLLSIDLSIGCTKAQVLDNPEYVNKLFKMPDPVEMPPGFKKDEFKGFGFISITGQFSHKSRWARPLIDRRSLDRIEGSQTRVYRVIPGLHEVRVATDDFGSNILKIHVEAGETKKLVCGSKYSGMRRVMLWPKYADFRNRYFYVKAASPIKDQSAEGRMNTELLVTKRNEINKLFSRYGDVQVRIAGSADVTDYVENPDVDIFVNLDESRDSYDLIVCVRRPEAFVRHPLGSGPVGAMDWLDVGMELVAQLNSLLNCSADLIDTRALQDFPISCSKFRLTE